MGGEAQGAADSCNIQLHYAKRREESCLTKEGDRAGDEIMGDRGGSDGGDDS